MFYTSIVTIAIVIFLITNHEFLFRKDSIVTEANKGYRRFLFAILAFLVIDLGWGIFDILHLSTLLYIDTVVYNVALVAAIALWAWYVMLYLDLKAKIVGTMVTSIGIFCLIEAGALLLNSSIPIFFSYDADGNYQTGGFRLFTKVIEILLFLTTGILTFIASRRSSGPLKERYSTIFLFSVVLIVTSIAQYLYPLLPCHTVGFLIGTCLIHSFVQENENEEIRRKLQVNEARLQENLLIISNLGCGIWTLRLGSDGCNEMFMDDTLKGIFGISGTSMTPEEQYRYYHSHLLEDVEKIESEDYRSMKPGEVRFRPIEWLHPEKGTMVLDAWGVMHPGTDAARIISGYIMDITDETNTRKRSKTIIDSLAAAYDYMFYLSMDEGTFITLRDKSRIDPELAAFLEHSDSREVLSFFCEKRVLPAFRSEMEVFTDLSTLDERLSGRSAIVTQFKTANDVWYEWSYVVAVRSEDGKIKNAICAIRRIEDEKQAELRKQRILEENIAANKAKTSFLQNMSHEIRTPLNAIVGYSQLLSMPGIDLSEDEKEEYNEYISRNSDMLTMLIDDILDISDEEHGNYRVTIGDCNCNEICKMALSSVSYRVHEGVNLYFTSDVPDDHIISSDGKRIQQVLINYLTNACKHTFDGEIHLHCSQTENPGKITFSVADTGTGVPADKIDVIFDRFTKLDEFSQGSGLGLNICRMIADKLHGDVFLDKTYSPGARFLFVIDNVR